MAVMIRVEGCWSQSCRAGWGRGRWTFVLIWETGYKGQMFNNTLFTSLFHVWRQPRNPALIRKRQKHIFFWALILDVLCFLTIILQPRGVPCSWLINLTDLWPKHYTAVHCVEGKNEESIPAIAVALDSLVVGTEPFFLFWLEEFLKFRCSVETLPHIQIMSSYKNTALHQTLLN